MHCGIKVLVHRSPDHGNGHISILQTSRVQSCRQLLADHSLEQGFGAFLQKRYPAAVDGSNLAGVNIEQSDPCRSLGRQHNSQGQTYVATTSHNDNMSLQCDYLLKCGFTTSTERAPAGSAAIGGILHEAILAPQPRS